MEQERWKIWYKQYDENGKEIGCGVHIKDYATRGWAHRVAREQYDDLKKFKYVVATRNPWVDYPEEHECDFCGGKHTIVRNHNSVSIGGYWRFSMIRPGKDWTERLSIYGKICDECAAKIQDLVEKIKAEKEKKDG